MIQALIFDFDGLMLDTELPEYRSWQDEFQAFGYDFPRALWEECIGTSATFDPYALLAQRLGGPYDQAIVRERRRARFTALMAEQIHDSQGHREEARLLYAQARTEMERRKAALPPARFDIVMAQVLAGLEQRHDALLHARRAVATMVALGDAAELPLHLYFKAIVHTRVGDRSGACRWLTATSPSPSCTRRPTLTR